MSNQTKQKVEKQTKQQKKEKYVKKFKKNYMVVNKLHLQEDQEEIEKLEKEQKSFKKGKVNFDEIFSKKKDKLSKEEQEQEILFETLKKERDILGYIRIVTNFGNLNCELYVSKAPKTCYNFIKLNESGAYNGSYFHRLIPGFMIQGGKTSTGSIFRKSFEDEINSDLKHDSLGVLSMANSGSNTNETEFFITFGPATHLDGKHTVFGKVVGGITVLQKLEKIKTKNQDKPVESIIIEKMIHYGNPFE